MKVKFIKKCKYSIDGLKVDIAEKDSEAEIPDWLAKRLCVSKFCIEVKSEPIEEHKPKKNKGKSGHKKNKNKPIEEDDFLS